MKNKLWLLILAMCVGNLAGCAEKTKADGASVEQTESSIVKEEEEIKSEEVDNSESIATKKEEIVPVVSTDTKEEVVKQEDKIENPEGEVEHKSYVVQEGDWLTSIAREVCGDSKLVYEIYEMNQEAINNPDFIYPGQILILPNN